MKRVCENCKWCVWLEQFERGTCACAHDGMRPIRDEFTATCNAWEDEEEDFKDKKEKRK